jgi:Sec-independent protein translocase protein TatA
MFALLLCVLVILAFLIVRKHPTLARDLGQSMDEFRKVLEEQLSRMGEEVYWSQYESGNSQNWEKRWKQTGSAQRAPFWARRKSWRLRMGRVLGASQY